MITSDHDSEDSEDLASLTTPFIIVTYKSLPSLYDTDGPIVLDRFKLVKTLDELCIMCKALTWIDLGVRTSGPDHWAR